MSLNIFQGTDIFNGHIILCCVDNYQSLLTELFTGMNNAANEHPDINLRENSDCFHRTDVWRAR